MSLSKRFRVLHIVPSFSVGGAEQFVGHLMGGLSQTHDVSGVGLYPARNSPIEERLLRATLPLWHRGKRPGFAPRMFSCLDRVLREARPHVVHTHMSVLRYALPGLLRRRIPVVLHTLNNMAERGADGSKCHTGRQVPCKPGRPCPLARKRAVRSRRNSLYLRGASGTTEKPVATSASFRCAEQPANPPHHVGRRQSPGTTGCLHTGAWSRAPRPFARQAKRSSRVPCGVGCICTVLELGRESAGGDGSDGGGFAGRCYGRWRSSRTR